MAGKARGEAEGQREVRRDGVAWCSDMCMAWKHEGKLNGRERQERVV
jgi:hypothetical protein